MSDTTLSLFSTYFAYAGLVVSSLAFAFFIASFSLSRTVAVDAGDAGEKVLVAAGGAPEVPSPGVAAPSVPAAPGRGARWANIGMSLSWLQAALLLAAVVLRGLSANRWPLEIGRAHV